MKNLVYGIIPARGGSKSIPLKNIKLLKNIPLIEHSIQTALKSKLIDKLIVSTDHEDIIKICKKYNDLIIIKRPASLSQDSSPTESCLIHACEEMYKIDSKFPDLIVTLEPTSPLRRLETINQCIQLLLDSDDSDSILCVTKTSACFGFINDNNKFQHFIKNQPRRRQDRKPAYIETGNVYVTRYEYLKKHRLVLCDNPLPYEITFEESIDINDIIDFKIAESLL